MRLHPDFNTHAFGHCAIFSGKKVTAPHIRKCPHAFVYLSVFSLSEQLFVLFIVLNGSFTCFSQSFHLLLSRFNISQGFRAGFSQDFHMVFRRFSHGSHSSLLRLHVSFSKHYSAHEVIFNSKEKVALTRKNVHVRR